MVYKSIYLDWALQNQIESNRAEQEKLRDTLQEREGASSNNFKQFWMILYYIKPFSCYI